MTHAPEFSQFSQECAGGDVTRRAEVRPTGAYLTAGDRKFARMVDEPKPNRFNDGRRYPSRLHHRSAELLCEGVMSLRTSQGRVARGEEFGAMRRSTRLSARGALSVPVLSQAAIGPDVLRANRRFDERVRPWEVDDSVGTPS